MKDALLIGKAAEHIVCADLLLAGYHAFLADQGSPFDVVAVAQGRLWRVQVKATQQAKNVNAKGRNPRVAYTWSVRRRGRDGGADRLSREHCDLVALVALDARIVAWFPVELCGETVQLVEPGMKPKTMGGKRSWARGVDGYPFLSAISGAPADFTRSPLTHCPKGHLYTAENRKPQSPRYPGGKPAFGCRECVRIASRERERVRRLTR